MKFDKNVYEYREELANSGIEFTPDQANEMIGSIEKIRSIVKNNPNFFNDIMEELENDPKAFMKDGFTEKESIESYKILKKIKETL